MLYTLRMSFFFAEPINHFTNNRWIHDPKNTIQYICKYDYSLLQVPLFFVI